MDLLSSLLMGAAYAAAPGPILVETFRQGVKAGFGGSLALQSGSMLGLAIYALLALFGSELLPQETAWQLLIGVSGMAVLLYLGITTIRSGQSLAILPPVPDLGGRSARRAFCTGAALSLANPLDIFFWLSVGSRGMSGPGQATPAYFGALFTGILVTSLLMALFAGLWHSRLTSRAALAVSWACGLALIGFGLRLGLSIGRQIQVW